jgi:hypothetical protein
MDRTNIYLHNALKRYQERIYSELLYSLTHENCECILPPTTNLPTHYILTKKATILFWDEDDKDDKTVVKRCDEDRHNPRLAFLTAYFQKHSGLSKNQANRYLSNLKGLKEKKPCKK